MGSGKSKPGMLSTTVAPLAAILMMTAVSAIVAGATDVGVACDERSFAPDDATLRGGRAVGAGRIRVLGGTAPIVPGQRCCLVRRVLDMSARCLRMGLRPEPAGSRKVAWPRQRCRWIRHRRLPPGSGHGGNMTTRSW